ncbi:MAG: hypothetical protein UHM23_01425 [Clostridia bacterium]|nr:hypothetical protein [Clostridia bacterium]
MNIKVNPLTILLFAVLTAMGEIKIYILAYIVMALHETAHLLAALFIGLKSESITFGPFGVNLKLKCRIIHSLADEIILYSAGPLVNAILAVMALYFKNVDFYRMNTALLVLNLLPVIPFDGGMIVLRICASKYGLKRAKAVLNTLSAVLGTLFFVFACMSVFMGYINISLYIIAVFLIGNIITSKSLYDTDFIEAVSLQKKRGNGAKLVVIDNSHSTLDAVKAISPSYTTIAVLLDSDGKVNRVVSEYEILEKRDFLGNML